MRIGRSYRFRGAHWHDSECNKWVLGLLGVLLVFGIFWGESSWRSINIISNKVQSEVVEVSSDEVPASLVGSLIHFKTRHVETEGIKDYSFQLDRPDAIRLRRFTEYCQWAETQHTEKDEENDETIVTYTYYKGWYSYRIVSLLFDQPFHHNNPTRDPYPSHTETVPHVRAGAYDLPRAVLDSWEDFRPLRLTPQDAANLQGSEAQQLHGFLPAGERYYYSRYEHSTPEMLAKLAGMFLEGSLDFQLGELFSTCTAGDIRVSYEVISGGEGMSVIAKLVDGEGRLGEYEFEMKSLLGFEGKEKIAMVATGEKDWEQMLDDAKWATWKWVIAARVILGACMGVFISCFTTQQGFLSTMFWGYTTILFTFVVVHGVTNLMNSLRVYPILTFMITLSYFYSILSLHSSFNPPQLKSSSTYKQE